MMMVMAVVTMSRRPGFNKVSVILTISTKACTDLLNWSRRRKGLVSTAAV
jgi:hypothetical protein